MTLGGPRQPGKTPTRRRPALIVALTLGALGVLGASAQAATYCVDTTSAGCTMTFSGQNATALQSALTQAGTDTSGDTLLLGAGTYDGSANAGFTYANTNIGSPSLTIIGAGVGQTVLDNSAAAATAVLAIGSDADPLGAASSVSGLTISMGPTTNTTASPIFTDEEGGLMMIGGSTISHVSVTSANVTPTTDIVNGIDFAPNGFSPIMQSVSSDPTAIGSLACGALVSELGLTTSPTVTVQDSSFGGQRGGLRSFDSIAAHRITAVLSGSDSSVSAVDFEANSTIDDSLLWDLATGPSTQGLFLSNGGFAMTNDTILGGATVDGTAIGIEKDGFAGSMTLSSSIVSGFTLPVSGTYGSVTIAYSDVLGAGGAASVPPDGTGNLSVAPNLVAFTGVPATSNVRPAPGSPLIDAGDPAPLGAGESTTDLGGSPRVQAGTFGGAPRRDIGAFEFPTPGPPPPPVVTPPVVKPVTPSKPPPVVVGHCTISAPATQKDLATHSRLDVSVRCSTVAHGTLSGALTLPGKKTRHNSHPHSRTLKLGSRTFSVTANHTTAENLGLSHATLTALLAAIAHHQTLTLKLTASGFDASGHHVSASETLHHLAR